jgi:hypothetical protein
MIFIRRYVKYAVQEVTLNKLRNNVQHFNDAGVQIPITAQHGAVLNLK